jgi:hypothetical protein
MATLTMYRGDTKVLQATLADEADVPINDPGATYKLTARSGYDAATTKFVKTTTQASAGTANFTISPSDTSGATAPTVWAYDVEVTEAGGRVTTIDRGTLVILTDITHA